MNNCPTSLLAGSALRGGARPVRHLAGLTLLLMATLTGCVTPRITDTARSAIEQNLLATAAERAVKMMDFSEFKNKKATMDYSQLATQVDKEYIMAVFETHLGNNGVKVVTNADNAEIRIKLFCGIFAADDTKFEIGTPELPIPVPYTDLSFAIPALSLFQKINRSGYCRIGAAVYDAKTDDFLKSFTGINTKTEYNNWVLILFFPFTTTDLELVDSGESQFHFFN